MAVQNSPTQAPGIGKNSKRHDLQGTPGLSQGSDLQYGDVKRLEAGQKTVAAMNRPAPVAGASPVPTQGGAPMQVPDPVSFATQKLGSARPALPTESTEVLDLTGYLPLVRQLATSDASPLLKKAYINMLRNARQAPINGGGTVLIDRQEFDDTANRAF